MRRASPRSALRRLEAAGRIPAISAQGVPPDTGMMRALVHRNPASTAIAPTPVVMAVPLLFWLCAALLAAALLAGHAEADTTAEGDGPAAAAPGAEPGTSGDPDFDRLLLVPSTPVQRDPARSADEAIAAAVRLGHGDRAVPRSGFRKRSRDLFRSEHPVEIGHQEMLVRLRLRARARRAMSVELRF